MGFLMASSSILSHPKIKKIQEFQKRIDAKHTSKSFTQTKKSNIFIIIFCENILFFYLYYILNFKQLTFSGEPMTQCCHESCAIVNHMRM